MKILELISFIESRVPGVYYPNRFPRGAADECISVKLTGGFPTSQWTGKKQPSFQVLVRGWQAGEQDCEDKANEIFDSLTNLREVIIGESSVVIIRASTSVPLFIGYDDNDRPQYSLNFDCVIRP
ncbi:minor capsid protein [Bacillus paralicheniformis]|uniref:minor capsid protein n=1 Tax=Bacillus paralicheniformis TaxID=1648923 RepID=UPI0022437136|nr:minor capsid protein [Bacillus paralicheniformis]MEC1023574.1 minor capsid protein [Bacillus paralicheniformis]MEC1027442.1 minor capsid protein [Bacillus paralicheniformis]MEC1034406.1 minor capsid protein [Bacillus paralicheniformis]MEC1050211.1 minor capsid protein [Bacillus paralicheniformis]MEC1059851.1 minor capsid protein [Bacillus paralicheniformis]